jgi:hypothetical protein
LNLDLHKFCIIYADIVNQSVEPSAIPILFNTHYDIIVGGDVERITVCIVVAVFLAVHLKFHVRPLDRGILCNRHRNMVPFTICHRVISHNIAASVFNS